MGSDTQGKCGGGAGASLNALTQQGNPVGFPC